MIAERLPQQVVCEVAAGGGEAHRSRDGDGVARTRDDPVLRPELDVAQAEAEAVPKRAEAVAESEDGIGEQGRHAVRVEGVGGEQERVGEARDVVGGSEVLLDGADRAPDGQSRVGLGERYERRPGAADAVHRAAQRVADRGSLSGKGPCLVALWA